MKSLLKYKYVFTQIITTQFCTVIAKERKKWCSCLVKQSNQCQCECPSVIQWDKLGELHSSVTQYTGADLAPDTPAICVLQPC